MMGVMETVGYTQSGEGEAKTGSTEQSYSQNRFTAYLQDGNELG